MIQQYQLSVSLKLHNTEIGDFLTYLLASLNITHIEEADLTITANSCVNMDDVMKADEELPQEIM